VAADDPSRGLVKWFPYVGLGLAFAVVIALDLIRRRDPQQARAILAGLGALFYAGKEAGLPTGISAGAPALRMGLFVFVADVAFTFLVYPPVHYFLEPGRTHTRVYDWIFGPLHAHADRHREFVQRYGRIGLFLIMLVPFAFNGPLLGAILGRIVGMRARHILPTLVLAIGFTTVFWTVVYALGLEYLAQVHPGLPQVVAGTVLAILTALGVLSYLRYQIGRRREALKEADGTVQARRVVAKPKPATRRRGNV
jgi:uncharacterized membrane protein